MWYNYFDLGTDYSAIKKALSVDPVLKKASEFGSGIKALGYLKGWALDRFGTNCARLGRADLAFLRLPLQYEQIMGIERCEFDSLFNF